MQAQVELDRAAVKQSKKQYVVAQRITAFSSRWHRLEVKSFAAIVKRHQDGEVKRLTGMAAKQVVDIEILSETRRQLKSSQALLEASRVTVRTRDAQRLAAEATVERTDADIRYRRCPGYQWRSPRSAPAGNAWWTTSRSLRFDGVVLAHNVSLGDFVLPASSDPSQGSLALGVSPNQATPLYLLNRIDPVLFVIGVPEADAAYVAAGSTARVRVPALANHEFSAKVTRTSWALNSTSRTLMAQVELPNPQGKFLPGMYAYGSVFIERQHVRALPASAVTQIGNQTYCYLALEGKAVRTPVQTGVSDGTWVEVTGKLVRSSGSSEGTWEAFNGSEAIIYGDLSLLVDGIVDVAPLGSRPVLGTSPDPRPVVQPTPARPHWRAGRELTVPRSGGRVPGDGGVSDIADSSARRSRSEPLDDLLHLDLPDADRHVTAVLYADRLPLEQRVDLDVLHFGVGQARRNKPRKFAVRPPRLIGGFCEPHGR